MALWSKKTSQNREVIKSSLLRLKIESVASIQIQANNRGIKMSEEVAEEKSLYDRIGGEAAVNAAVDLFYRKVLEDYRINRFFGKTDMDTQIAKQRAFFTMAFGGPNNYTGGDMRTVHARLVKMGLDDSHFDAVMEHLGATLTELNVPGDLIAEAAAIAESTRADVLGK
jgi:hemoglobin